MRTRREPAARDVVVVADTTETWPSDTWRFDTPDLFVSLGDLHTSAVRELTVVAPVFGVYGNHCERGYLEAPRCTDLSGGKAADTGMLGSRMVLGVSGGVRCKEGTSDVLYSQEEYAAVLGGISTALDIVVTHCPPAGVNDHEDAAHAGIEALVPLIARCRPTLLLHGHTYPEPPIREMVVSTPDGPHRCEVLYVQGHWRGRMWL